MNEEKYIWDYNKEYLYGHLTKKLYERLYENNEEHEDEYSWGEEMQNMLERDYPVYTKSKHANQPIERPKNYEEKAGKYTKSKHANQPIERPKNYEEKAGNKRKIFVLNEESED